MLRTRGSSAFEDDADIVWRTKRAEDSDDVTVELAKRKDGPDGLTLRLRGRLMSGTGSLVLESAHGLPSPSRSPKQALPTLKVLSQSAAVDGLSMTAIAETLGLRGKGSVTDSLSWLMDSGYVMKCPRGRILDFKITESARVRLSQLGEN